MNRLAPNKKPTVPMMTEPTPNRCISVSQPLSGRSCRLHHEGFCISSRQNSIGFLITSTPSTTNPKGIIEKTLHYSWMKYSK